MKLDVGCGHNPTGDVNVDLFTEATKHRPFNTPLKLKTIPNFVKADACHLPFKSGTFEEVYSHHVIEHTNNPFPMVKEMVRVSKYLGEIRIICPHKYASRRALLHASTFNQSWFVKAFGKLGVNSVHGRVTLWRSIPHSYVHFPYIKLPSEIEIVAIKDVR